MQCKNQVVISRKTIFLISLLFFYLFFVWFIRAHKANAIAIDQRNLNEMNGKRQAFASATTAGSSNISANANRWSDSNKRHSKRKLVRLQRQRRISGGTSFSYHPFSYFIRRAFYWVIILISPLLRTFFFSTNYDTKVYGLSLGTKPKF